MNRKFYFSLKPDSQGQISIISGLGGDDWLKEKAIQILLHEMKLPISKTHGTLETIAIMDTPKGIPIQVVDDQFFGIMVETMDVEFLKDLADKLEALVKAEDVG